jgi:hypothetical protein
MWPNVEQCVSAHWGWAGEKDCLFEHPANRSLQCLTAFAILDYKTWHAFHLAKGA